MTDDQKQHAADNARTINDQYGPHGAVVIAERIGALAAAKDQAQFNLWMAIGAQFIKLQGDAQTQWETARRFRQLLDTLL